MRNISFENVRTVFQKEITESFRDKKVILTNFVLPFVIMPIVLILSAETFFSEAKKEASESLQTVVISPDPPTIYSALVEDKRIQYPVLGTKETEKLSALLEAVTPIQDRAVSSGNSNPKKPPPEEVEKLEDLRNFLTDLKVDLVIYEGTSAIEDQRSFKIYHDGTHKKSKRARDIASSLFEKWKEELIKKRMEKQKLQDGFLEPIQWDIYDAAILSQTYGSLVGKFIPFALIYLLLLGSFYPAIGSTIGEKEKGTLFSVLCTPISTQELILGKFLNITLLALLSVLSYTLSWSLMALVTGATHGIQTSLSFISIQNPLALIIVVICTALLVSSLAFCIAVLGRNYNESQTYLSLFLIVLVLPVAAVPIMDLNLSTATAFIPILNSAAFIQGTFIDPVPFYPIMVSVFANLLWAWLFLGFSVQIFASEHVLFRNEGGLGEILTLKRVTLKDPNPALSVMIFFVIITFSFYFEAALGGAKISWVTTFNQFAFMLALPLLALRYFRLNIKEVIQFREPPPYSLLAVLIMIPSCVFFAVFLSMIIPVPEEVVKEFEKALGVSDRPFFELWLLLAIVPGICEEVAFRGVIQPGFLKRFPPITAILLTSLLFGLAHFSVYRFVPTAFIGFMLGYLAWKSRSIFPGMILHIFYNSGALLLSKKPEWAQKIGVGPDTVSVFLPVLAIAGMSLAIVILDRYYLNPRVLSKVPRDSAKR